MGIYLNPGNESFQQAVNSEIYVDKTKMMMETNSILCTEQKYVCISRPRRFGKSMAANMLAAYYSRGCDSKELFSPFQIGKADSFEKHLNQYNVIQINLADFAKKSDSLQEVLKSLQDSIVEEITKEYPDFRMPHDPSLLSVLEWHYLQYKQPFVIVIDDWDCIIRMKQFTANDQMDYLHFLLVLLKDQSYVALAFMTGILPIKKSGNQLSVDMFTEVTMTLAAPYDEFTGFTEEEVMALCQRYQYDPQEMDAWYGGYRMKRSTIYHPGSVADSILNGKIQNYWKTIETPKELSDYINLNFYSLREKITGMITGEKIKVNPAKFQNDLTSFRSADDVLTLLIHLGYLTYDFDTKTAWIPNNEVQQEFINAIEDGGWEMR